MTEPDPMIAEMRRRGQAFARSVQAWRTQMEDRMKAFNEGMADVINPQDAEPSNAVKWADRYPYSETFTGEVKLQSGHSLIIKGQERPEGFEVGMPVTVYGPSYDGDGPTPKVRVRAGTVTYSGKTVIFVDKETIPPGSLVEVRLIAPPLT